MMSEAHGVEAMTDSRRDNLANLIYADLMVSGAYTPNQIKAALLESVRSLESSLKIEVGEVTEEDRRLRRTPAITVALPRLP
jgi:glycine cleavage system H lipoate-binding protein